MGGGGVGSSPPSNGGSANKPALREIRNNTENSIERNLFILPPSFYRLTGYMTSLSFVYFKEANSVPDV